MSLATLTMALSRNTVEISLENIWNAIRAERILKEVGGMTHIREHVQRGRFTLAINDLRTELGR